MIIYSDSNDLLPIDNNSIFQLYAIRTNNKLIRMVRKLHLISWLPFKSIWFGSWKKRIDSERMIILFDTGNAEYVINYIRNKNKSIRLILFYWGPVEISVPLSTIDRSKCEIWTFDKRDAQRYELKLNTQFYTISNLSRTTIQDNSKILYDACFIGTEKNRLNNLLLLKKQLDDRGLIIYFHITKSGKQYQSNDSYDYKEKMSYPEMLNILIQSKCIVDIVADDQTGLTLRPMEALFFKKKLITNQASIVEHPIYRQSNIFILGVDDIETIYDFVNSSYDVEQQEYLENYYNIDSWIGRFN